MSHETTTEMTTTEMTRAEKRAAARADKIVAKIVAETRRAELIAEAADALASHRAGVKDAQLTAAMELAIKAAALTIEGVKARNLLLEDTEIKIPGSIIYLAEDGKGYWTRQDGEFLREYDDLDAGSYATGRTGRPYNTSHGYVFLRAETRQEQVLVACAKTKAEKAGAVAQAAVEDAWREIEAAADALEQSETS